MGRSCVHYAIIPARAGSKGFPGKNRLFFNYLADFLDRSGLFSSVLVTTDDPVVAGFADRRGYFVRQRPQALAADSSKIKEAIVDLVDSCPFLKPDDYLWLTCATILHRSVADFRDAHAMVETEAPPAFCTFIPVATHPYIAWYQDPDSGKMRQYIPNDAVNRQDMPPAYRNYHYIIGFKVSALPSLNSNLLGEITRPIYLDQAQQDALCDLDGPADLLAWKSRQPDEFSEWRRSIPSEVDLSLVKRYLDSDA